MRVLVTGAAGFAGAFLAKELLRANFDVVGAYRSESEFLAGLQRLARLELVPAELAASSALPGPFDAVVHTAATSPSDGITAGMMVRDNVEATRALIEAAKKWGCQKFIFFSSISLHGEIQASTLDEATPIFNPDLYGATKHVCECLLESESDELPSLSLRLPGVLGPGARRNWLSRVAADIRAGKPVQAFNLAGPFNNAAHVFDICKMVVEVLRLTWVGHDAVVLGAAGALPVRDVLQRLAVGLNSTINIVERENAKAPFIISSQRAIERWRYEPTEIGLMIDRYAAEYK